MGEIRNRKGNRSSKFRSSAKRRDEDADSNKPTPVWYYLAFLALISGGAFQVLIPMFAGISRIINPGFTALTVADTEMLKNVFQGGDPWVILCKKDETPVPKFFDKAADLAAMASRTSMYFGTLDCTHLLPSGRTTYELHGLEAPASRSDTTAFIIANGGKAKPVPLNYFTDPQIGPERLISYVSSQTKPKLTKVSANAKLQQHCFHAKHCALVLSSGSRMTADDEETLDTLMDQFRLVKFVKVDIKRHQLSIENKLPPVTAGIDHLPRVIYFRRNKTRNIDVVEGYDLETAAVAHRGGFDSYSVAAFLDEALDTAGTGGSSTGLKTLPSLPKLRSRPSGTKFGVKKAKKPKRTAKKAEKAKKAKKAKRWEDEMDEEEDDDDLELDLDDEEAWAAREKAAEEREKRKAAKAAKRNADREKKQREKLFRQMRETEAKDKESKEKLQQERARERRRREEMDREAEENLAQAVDLEEENEEGEGSEEDTGEDAQGEEGGVFDWQDEMEDEEEDLEMIDLDGEEVEDLDDDGQDMIDDMEQFEELLNEQYVPEEEE